MGNLLAPNFDSNFRVPLNNKEFFKTVSEFSNNDFDVHMKFIFDLFCYEKDDENKVIPRITEKGLFKFMKDASKLHEGVNENPTEVLELTQVDSDTFLDIFQQTYSVIAKALQKKINK
jgi:hypothetical protein